MNLEGGIHLRVGKVRTTNGVNPVIGADGRLEYRYDTFPITAKPHFESLNKKLDGTMKMTLEVVGGKSGPQIPADKLIHSAGHEEKIPAAADPVLSAEDIRKLVADSVQASTHPILDALVQFKAAVDRIEKRQYERAANSNHQVVTTNAAQDDEEEEDEENDSDESTPPAAGGATTTTSRPPGRPPGTTKKDANDKSAKS